MRRDAAAEEAAPAAEGVAEGRPEVSSSLKYRVLHPGTAVGADAELAAEQIRELAQGDAVEVVEIRSLEADKRVRGRLAEGGWISIFNTENGYAWAVPETAEASKPLLWRPAWDGSLGVFAGKAFAAGDLVERCYCLSWDWHHPCRVRLWLYDQGANADLLFPLGWGLLYNSPGGGTEPNLRWELETEKDSHNQVRRFIRLSAVRAIEPGEELCVHRVRACQSGAGSRRECRDAVGTRLANLERDSDVSAQLRRREFRGILADYGPQEASLVSGILGSPDTDGIAIRSSPLHGYGVFAVRSFQAGEVVEITPCVPLRDAELGKCLNDYYFDSFVPILALGFGSVYNHHNSPNLMKIQCKTFGCARAQRLCFSFVAKRDICAGEELFHSYGAKWWDVRKDQAGRAGLVLGGVGAAALVACSVQ